MTLLEAAVAVGAGCFSSKKQQKKGNWSRECAGGGSLSGNTDTSCFGCGVTQSPGWALESGKEDEEEGGSERGV